MTTSARGAGSPIREIVATLLPSYPELDADERRDVEQDVAAYVAGQIAAMPPFLQLPYRSAILAFDLISVPRHGRRFRRLPPPTRESYLALWSEAPLSAMRDFVKLIRSTTLLVYFDHPLVRDRLRREGADAEPSATEDLLRE